MASNNKHEYDEHFHWLIALWDLCAVYIYPPLRFRHLHFFSLHFEIIVALKPSKTNGVLLWLVRSWETFLLLCPWPNLRSTSCFETNLKELQSKCLARHFMICLLYIIAVSTESINTDLQEFFFPLFLRRRKYLSCPFTKTARAREESENYRTIINFCRCYNVICYLTFHPSWND